jgi:asparagine synthase (glutamine-hydrolysing)
MIAYYGWAGPDFVFASELKALRLHPRFDGEIDRRALSLFASRTYVPAPVSIYRGIFKLEPGCVLELDAGAAPRPLTDAPAVGFRGGGLSVARYWSYRDVLRRGLDDPIGDESEALEQLEQVLARAVQSQSIADVPVGAFLSGGIDSSTIVALYQKYSPRPVRTFTIGFEEKAFNEADYARAVAAHFGAEHHERIVTPAEAREVIPMLPRMYDEPFADSSQIPTFLVSRFAREQVTVALSGDGGDELFGGYKRYFGTSRLWSKLKLLPAPIRAAAGASLGRLSPAVWDGIGGIAARGRLPPNFGMKVRKALLTVAGARNVDELFLTFLDEWPGGASPVLGADGAERLCPFDLELGTAAPDALRMMYCDALSFLPDDILCKVDRASMAVSLEVHSPYLDHRVAELAARMPVAMKIRGGTGKRILRKLLYREAPAQLFERPKTGFGIPVGQWIKGPLREWAEDLLDPAALRSQGWFDPEPIARRWRDHLSGRRDSTQALWAVLMFQAWLREQRVER